MSENGSDGEGLATGLATHPCRWDTCSFTSSTFKNLYEHIIEFHLGSIKKTDDWVCKWTSCPNAKQGKLFNKREHLKSHIMSHVNYFPFACQYCNQQFKRRPDLNKHINKSLGCQQRLHGLSLWDNERVCKWLADSDLHGLEGLFKARNINGETLMVIDDRFLLETLNITDQATRERLLALIRAKKRSYRGADTEKDPNDCK
ncbi:hypothetical protein SARC_00743 [Sphaeroforma arctica JP610]|uniref:SAM domain-containing protein n=1 Tax=Sphaeroforma arctica JP610 TaxID=667725 RepID=A0A0L0GDP4_9EUKA|nr:hypothetical protein SARC_00743 [Sphaeroforma arctica JP610]KNC87120.1 hypothetical protein SARC_00743 [Sphaeroforma arctica JP610]|eukprot:XP_014161022.1 hypothetical protein SARC_00743 [Sphaeroforma arctica JP610]